MLDSARLKVERAQRHIAEIESEFGSFAANNPHSISTKSDPVHGNLLVRVRIGGELPDNIALAIGDAVHNARVALDHMTWAVVGADGGTQNRYLKLPAGSDQRSFEGSCQGISTPSQEVKDILKALQVFPCGRGEKLYELHLLDIEDKHKVLKPAVRASIISGFSIIHPDGSVMATVKDMTLVGADGEYTGLGHFGKGLSVEFEPGVQITPELYFKIANHGLHCPVISTLKEFVAKVTNTIDEVESACCELFGR